jgi:hypothetical protein
MYVTSCHGSHIYQESKIMSSFDINSEAATESVGLGGDLNGIHVESFQIIFMVSISYIVYYSSKQWKIKVRDGKWCWSFV